MTYVKKGLLFQSQFWNEKDVEQSHNQTLDTTVNS